MEIKFPRIVLLAAAGAVAYALAITHDEKQPHQRAAAPTFSLQSTDGATVTLESLRGHPVLVNFWATWCPPCRAELPDLERLWESREGCLDVVGIALQSGGAESVARFAHDRGVRYPLLLGDGVVARAWGVDLLPHSALLDAQGNLVRTWDGQIDPAQVRAAVSGLAPAPSSC